MILKDQEVKNSKNKEQFHLERKWNYELSLFLFYCLTIITILKDQEIQNNKNKFI